MSNFVFKYVPAEGLVALGDPEAGNLFTPTL